ncbi:hypothetical protein AVEN_53347-1, partial [Araneus ventricosus]
RSLEKMDLVSWNLDMMRTTSEAQHFLFRTLTTCQITSDFLPISGDNAEQKCR